MRIAPYSPLAAPPLIRGQTQWLKSLTFTPKAVPKFRIWSSVFTLSSVGRQSFAPPGVPCDTGEFVSTHDYAEARLERIPIHQAYVDAPGILTKERNDVLHAVKGLNSPRRE